MASGARVAVATAFVGVNAAVGDDEMRLMTDELGCAPPCGAVAFGIIGVDARRLLKAWEGVGFVRSRSELEFVRSESGCCFTGDCAIG